MGWTGSLLVGIDSDPHPFRDRVLLRWLLSEQSCFSSYGLNILWEEFTRQSGRD